MEKVYLFMANGTEECEALIVLDILKRADINIYTVSVNNTTLKNIITSHNVKIECDLNINEVEESDAICFIIPGGAKGVQNLYNNHKFKDVIKTAYKNNKIIAAICAAPSILGKLNIFTNSKEATCYPGFEESFKNIYVSKKVVVDNNIITARSLGSSFEFSFKILEKLTNKNKVMQIKKSLHYNQK